MPPIDTGDTAWVLVSAALVMLMTPGLALFYGGLVRRKNVLSFPLHEWTVDGGASHLADDDGVGPPGPMLLGDVVIDVDQAERQAREGSWSVAEEMVLLAIHGTLHLLGHDHAELDEEAAMRDVEHHVLRGLHRKHHEVAWKPGSLFDRAGHALSSGS